MMNKYIVPVLLVLPLIIVLDYVFQGLLSLWLALRNYSFRFVFDHLSLLILSLTFIDLGFRLIRDSFDFSLIHGFVFFDDDLWCFWCMAYCNDFWIYWIRAHQSSTWNYMIWYWLWKRKCLTRAWNLYLFFNGLLRLLWIFLDMILFCFFDHPFMLIFLLKLLFCFL